MRSQLNSFVKIPMCSCEKAEKSGLRDLGFYSQHSGKNGKSFALCISTLVVTLLVKLRSVSTKL